MTTDIPPCACGHPFDAHEHYRAGTDCTFCGPDRCPRFRRPGWWRKLVAGRRGSSRSGH